MNTKPNPRIITAALLLSTFSLQVPALRAQGTAFTYNGRLITAALQLTASH
jgi:hypothetical protein